MVFSAVRVQGFRVFKDTDTLPLGPVTVLTGPNNSGKSTLLRAIYLLQEGTSVKPSDIRIGSSEAIVELVFSDRSVPLRLGSGEQIGTTMPGAVLKYSLDLKGSFGIATLPTARGQQLAVQRPPSQDPGHLIHPIFSGRFSGTYQQPTDLTSARHVGQTDQNIVSRVKQIAAATHPEARRFRTLCQEVLGVTLEALDVENGAGQQQLGVSIDRHTRITWDAMGTGLLSTLNLLVTLSTAKEKVILVEEPENDLHPKALNVLLDAIVESSDQNQFLVSTHNSTVLTRLGKKPDSVVLYVQSDGAFPPTSQVTPIATAEQRLGVLADLGYNFSDLELGDGWLIFEESSAQRVVQQFLIPWFAPGLARLRLIGASGDSRVVPLMLDFKEMFLFAHLEAAYKNRAWVIVDGSPTGTKIVSNLRQQQFPTWEPSRFDQWQKSDFELYYPSEFKEQIDQALAAQAKDEKRRLKKQLLDDVVNWILEDEDRAKKALEQSASEVIAKLRLIEQDLKDLPLGGSSLSPPATLPTRYSQ